jgi:glycosyltransferase involved in cell wall biosynthesis
MALEIPTIMSPVGVNTEIIKDGTNGFLASEINEWVEKMSHLIENSDLRISMGKQARKTVIDHYSVESQKNRYLDYFRQLTS